MAEIFNFLNEVEKRRKVNEFTLLLERASRSKKEIFKEEKGFIILKNEFENFFASQMNSFLINEKKIAEDIFLCVLYVSSLIKKRLSNQYSFDYIIDYFLKGFEKENPLFFQEGGDFCYFICVFFPELFEKRGLDDYGFDMGRFLYYQFYLMSEQEIAYHMSRNFKEMVEIGQKCLR